MDSRCGISALEPDGLAVCRGILYLSQPVPHEVVAMGPLAVMIKKKLQEYFAAGVQVVWYLYPAQQQVEVYHSPKDVVICTDDDPCSAAPAVADLVLTPTLIFAR